MLTTILSYSDISCFSVLCFIELHSLLLLLQIEGVWQPCTEQVYQPNFANCLCSFPVFVTFWWFSQYFKFPLLLYFLWWSRVFHVGSDSKESAVISETWVWSLDWEDPLEKGMATHFSIFAWRIWWTEEPGGGKESDMAEWLTL